jgi:pyruvate,water dikinase
MLIRQLKQQYLYRERIRFDLTRVVAALRRWHLTLADRFVERGWLKERDDYFLLLFAEVGRAAADPACGSELGAIAARRAAQLAAERHLAMPLFMRESELPSLLRAGAAGDGASADELSGLCVSPGAVEGEVVVLRDPSEFAKMKRGAVLVTTATDPAWTPMFTLASGVVVEVGGMLSHASTIAREYGLPALANVKNATKILRTGDRVRLDASAGVVRRLAAGAALVSVSAGPS